MADAEIELVKVCVLKWGYHFGSWIVTAILVRVILVRRTKLSSGFGRTPDNLDRATPDNLDRLFWLPSNPAIKECISNL